MDVRAVKTSVFKEKDDLRSFIVRYINKSDLDEKAVLVITSKIVALSEGRTADIREKRKLIVKESEFAMPAKYAWLTIKDGAVVASAGIDESNGNGKLVLLPENSYKTAALIRKFLCQKYKIKNLGVLITDSRTIPLRAGIAGMAVGYAGFKGIKDYRGAKDLFGRKFRFSRVNMADGLAAAAVLAIGEGDEQTPLAIIKSAPIVFCDRVSKKEMYINPKDDMYGPLFVKISSKSSKINIIKPSKKL